MNPEERAKKEEELKAKIEQLTKAADAATTAAGEAPGDEAAQKTADEAEQALKDAEAELANLPAAKVEGKDEKETEEGQDIDFEKELKELEGDGTPPAPERSELEKAERSLHFNAEQVRKLGGDPTKIVAPKAPPTPPAEVPKEKDDRYATKEDLAEQEAAKLSRTEAQRKVVMWHYKNSIKPTGNIIKDIENAFMIANKGRITRSFDEIRRTRDARPAPGGGGAGRRAPLQPKPTQISAQDEQILRRRGFKPKGDGTWESKRYIGRFEAGKGFVTTRKQ